MAYFAEIDETNTVIRVLLTDDDYPNKGHDWLVQTFGGTWIEGSIDGSLRKNYPAEGMIYDIKLDAFVAPKPFASWTLNTDTCVWEPPTPKPSTDKLYLWDENAQTWNEVTNG